MITKSLHPIPGKYINPLVDFAFKKIFGSEPNKDLLIAFLNEVLRGKKHITDLVYNKNEYPGDIDAEGSAIFDLLCTGDNGEQFLIEVQRSGKLHFKERALFYVSRLISEQAPKGDRKAWAYNLTEVYFIALLEDFALSGPDDDKYIYDIALCDIDSHKIFYSKMGYTYIELANFTKHESDLDSDLDKWLFLLKNLGQMNKIPVYFRKPIFEKLFAIATYSNLTKSEKAMYDERQKRKWDAEFVKEVWMHEGIEKGREEGRQEGRQEEKLKALAEKKEMARAMLKLTMPLDQISAITKLTIEQIQAL